MQGHRIELDREPAAAWARRLLAEPALGQATVIYHSIVSQYLSDEERHLARVGYHGTPVELL